LFGLAAGIDQNFGPRPPTGIELLGANIEFWYFREILIFFNALTLSFYAFAFFPWPVSTISQLRPAGADRSKDK